MTPDQLEALTARLDHQETQMVTNRSEWQGGLKKLADGHSEMRHDLASIRVELAENTVVTTEVRDYLAAAKGFFKVMGGIGAMGRWIAAVGAAIGALYGAIHFWPTK